ncbi:MAG: gamma-glutamyl-gamma-aminobutyrate hydrolase family protein, partial [Parachlamydiaceae bacterium]
VPIMLPPLTDEVDLERQLDVLDVLVISGGEDVDPIHYGEEPSPLLGELSAERDIFELQLVRLAYERNIPMFGICRGLQVMNVAFGGSLYQDVSQLEDPISHLQNTPRHQVSHHIVVDETSLLHYIFQKKEIHINSFHHQGIKQLAPILCANCFSTDGLIEGIEGIDQDRAPLIGVQWHPEMMAVAGNQDMLKLFHYFNSLSATTHGGRR